MRDQEPAAEVEGKLLAPSARTLDRIAQLTRTGADAVVRRRSQRLHSVYLDTPDFALTRYGIGLRLRRDGARWEATVKWAAEIDGAVHARPELNVALDGEPPQPFALPEGPLRTHLCAYVMDRPLLPILLTDIHRRRRDVLGRGAPKGQAPLAEIALDEVTLRSPDGHAFASYNEVEIEARRAGHDKVQSLTQSLQQRFGLQPSPGSKLAVGLGLLHGDLGPHPASFGSPDRSDTVSSAVRKIVARQLQRLRSRDAGARTFGAPDALHEMRVATRRLRTALRVFRIAIPPRLCDELQTELRWLGGCLGAVRDLDVQLGDLDKHAVALPGSYRNALAPFRRYLEAQRDERREILADALSSPRYFQVLSKLDGLAASRPQRERLPPAAHQPFPAATAAASAKALRRLRKRGRQIASAGPELLHNLRIRVKRARYLHEFFEDLSGKAGRRVVRRLVQTQDLLGAFNDAVVIADLVCRYLDRPQTPCAPSTALALQEFAQARLRETGALRTDFARAWRKFASKRTRKSARRATKSLLDIDRETATGS